MHVKKKNSGKLPMKSWKGGRVPGKKKKDKNA